MGKQVKVKPASIRIVVAFLAILLLISVLANFNVIDFTSQVTQLITLFAAFFVMSEIGLMALLRVGRGKLKIFELFGIIVAIVAAVSAVLGMFNIIITVLQPIQGILSAVLLVYVIKEIFT